MEAAGEGLAEGWFQLMRLIKRIGLIIIEFLAQIENFQKMLWEKKKFITETFYIITLGNVPEVFYPDIADNAAQWEEWDRLLAIESRPQDLFSGNWRTPEGRVAFLKAHPSLPLDTRHFPPDFTDRLLGSFDNLEEMTDGLLIHSENWQALNLLQEKYRERVKCLYIDPPYNAQSSEILYKNDYKHSSWLTLMENRLSRTRGLLEPRAVAVIAIDEVEQEVLGLLLSSVFSDKVKTCVTVVHNATGQQGNNFSSTHEYAYFVYPSDGISIGLQDRRDRPDVRPLRNVSKGAHLRSTGANCFYPIFIEDGEIVGFGDVSPPHFHPGTPNIRRPDGIIEVYPIDQHGTERKWVFARDTVESIRHELTASYDERRGIWDIIRTKTRFNYKTVWTDSRYSANSWGSRLLNAILGDVGSFSFPKSLYTVRDSIDAALGNAATGLVLDYFAGSGTTGHAVINLNREDGGRRKFILVEMADYFDTVLLPRLKKVTFSPEWKDGKPKRVATAEEAERGPRIIKVIRLESYEDALNNLSFDESAGQTGELQFEDYLLNYILRWETRKSETLLNAEKLSKPFDYCLHIYRDGETRVQKVDLPETFNYLIGLDVAKRKVLDDSGRCYLVYRGLTREGKRTVVIWRETAGWTEEDYKRDRDFVAKQRFAEDADVIYANGDSLIPGAQALEGLFKAKMFAGVEG
jgi:adenine-specific DNA-methyltransferase